MDLLPCRRRRPRPHPRPRPRRPPPPQQSRSETLTIPDDSILLEILIRLPTKSAHRFKCVSKSWNSLLSLPYFIRRFSLHRCSPSALLFQYKQDEKKLPEEKIYIISSSEDEDEQQVFASPGFSLRFVPCYDPEDRVRPLRVVASCNDLLLCRSNSSSHNTVYFVCNPLSMHCAELPPAPRHPLRDNSVIGLACLPPLVRDGQIYRYTILRILGIPPFAPRFAGFKVEIFSSETDGKWIESYVPCPPGFEYGSSGRESVFHDGIFYWAACGGILTIDVFGRTATTTHGGDSENGLKIGFILLPEDYNSGHTWRKTCLGLCRGRLRLSQVYPDFDLATLSVWELKDDPLCTTKDEWWCLQHRSRLFEPDSDLTKLAQSHTELAGPMAFDPVVMSFHPRNCDIVYLYIYGGIVLYNFRSKTWRMGSRTPPNVCRGDMYPKSVFPLELPYWPTPIPTLPLNAIS